jgi:hypothetical protein
MVMVQSGTALAMGIAAHTAYNLTVLRNPTFSGVPISEPVSILIPARNEAENIAAAVESACAQVGLVNLEVIILDDASTDATPEIIAQIASRDSRVQLISSNEDPPKGWMGKQFACHRLSNRASGSILVFVDADVVLAPDAIAACIELLRSQGLALVAPYPHQVAHTILERLVQPLVIWAWAATLPVGIAEKSLRPSLSAANGQMLVVDADAYRQSGGHESVKNIVLEDIGLMRSLKTAGHHCVTVNGSDLAECRMYDSPDQLVDGYTKSLWSAFGSPAGSIAVNTLLASAYLIPPIAMITARKKSHRVIGAAGYLAGVASRALVARQTGGRVLPDSFAHPASIAAFIGLNAVSWSRHMRGTNTWKGRSV